MDYNSKIQHRSQFLEHVETEDVKPQHYLKYERKRHG